MSYYDDRRHRSTRDRDRPTGYVEETYVNSRGGNSSRMDLVRRYDDSGDDDEVIEEVQRDFPPGEYSYGVPRRSKVTTVREGVRRARSVGGRDPYYGGGYYRRDDDRRPGRYDGRRDRRPKHSSSSRSPSPRPRRRKSLSEQALSALGLGGAVGAAAGKNRDDDRGRERRERRHHRSNPSYSSSPSRSRSRPRDKSEQRIAQAVKAALVAGAAEAFRARNKPGGWTGEKGKRVLTAAIAASGVDGLIDRDPDKHDKRHIIEATLAGLAANHLLNGPASRSRSRGRGSRGQSHSRGGIKDIASAGVLAAAGKEIYDRVRSKSRGRHRSSSRDSYYSDDDSPPRHRRSKKRSQSVSDYISKGLEALGLDEGEHTSDRKSRRGRSSSRKSDDSYDDYSSSDDDYRSRRRDGGRDSREVGRLRAPTDTTSISTRARTPGQEGHGSNGGGGNNSSSSDSDSDLGSSSDEKRMRKKLRRKELVTTGLATVATIHAAHTVVKGMEQRRKRMEQLKEGEITPEEARKRRIKADLADAASIGLAALGIKGAIGEWKEANEKRAEFSRYKHECEERRRKREMRRARSQSTSYPSRRHGFEYEDGNPYSSRALSDDEGRVGY